MAYRDRLTEILKLLVELFKTTSIVRPSDVADEIGLHPESVRRYFVVLAKKYPDHLIYERGILFLKKPFSEEVLTPEVRLERALKERDKKIAEKTKVILEAKERLEKLKNNHLKHGEKEKIRRELEDLIRLLERGGEP